MANQETDHPERHLSLSTEAEEVGIMDSEHRIQQPSPLGATNRKIGEEHESETASLRAAIENKNQYIKRLEDEIRCLKDERANVHHAINNEINELLPILKRVYTNTRCSTSTLGTLRARFTDISTLSDEEIHSNSINVAGMDWAISIQKQVGEDSTKCYLMAFLEIVTAPIPKTWSGSVSYTIKLIRYTDEQPYSTHGTGLIFSAENGSWGRDCFIDFEDLLNPSNNYVKEDSINMEIDFTVYPAV